MSFTGDLEHLSIVDVVQLLHATRKSGTLTVTGAKGAAQLVFSDGFIVSANHFDDRLRIGAILVGAGVVGEADLQQALTEQVDAGDRRKPLIAALIESGRVKKSDAFRGLEALIELTIVDILTWKSGSFTLDVGAVAVADEYRYFPERLREDLHFNTENVLMEALRIYDEKKRDGRLIEEEAPTTSRPPAGQPPAGSRPAPAAAAAPAPLAAGEADDVLALGEEAELALSPDDLGLADVEHLERRIPAVFTPIEDRPAVSPHREAIRNAAPDLPESEQEQIARFLEAPPERASGFPGPPLAAVLLAADDLLSHCLGAVCRHEGIALFTTTDPEDIAPFAEHQRGKGRVPVLVIDQEGTEPGETPAGGLSQLGTVRLVPVPGSGPVAWTGVATLLPRPSRRGRTGAFAPDFVRFLSFFPAQLIAHAREQGAWTAAATRQSAVRLRGLGEAAAVAQAVLSSVAALGTRALLLVVRGGELVSASGPGLHQPGSEPVSAPGVRVALAQAPLLQQAVGTERCLIAVADESIAANVHPAIGPPADPTVLLVPLVASGRTVSLVYADYGPGPAAPPPVDLLETIAAQAATALELVLIRKKIEKLSR